MAAEVSTELKDGTVMKKRKHRAAAVVGAAAVVLLGAVGFFAGRQMYENYQHQQLVASVIDTQTFYPGIVVQGVDLGGKTMEQAKAAMADAEQSLRGNYQVKITYGGKSWDITQDSLDFSYDTDKILGEAYSYARSGDREQRFQQVEALKSTPKTYTLTKTIEEQSLKDTIQKIADDVTHDPVNPTVTGFDLKTKTFQFKDGTNGATADAGKLFTEVINILKGSGTGAVTVPTASVPFTVPLSELKSRMKELGTYSTVSKNSAAGTHNMSLALATVNGIEVKPGAEFSFLGVIGPGDASQGYEKAGAILNGKLVQEDGGGICQASTTIYGAAMRSDMKITERSNHSIPSSYCPIGQDATVSYPSLDFKFQNPTDYPVFVVTQTKGKDMTATIYGYQSPDYDSIEVTSKITQTLPVSTAKQYTEDDSLPKGTIRLETKPRAGYRAATVRTFYLNGKVVKTENLPSSYYKPQPAFYSYGKGTDLSKGSGTSAASQKSSSSSSKPSSSASSKPSPASAAPVPDDDVTAEGAPAA